MQSPHDQDNSYGHHQYLPGRTPAVNEPQAQLPTAPSSSLITSPPGRDSPPPFPTASCEADYNDRSIQNHDNGSNAPPPPPHGDSFQTLRPSYSLAMGQPPSPLPWSSGIYACFQDMSGCCLTFWCPCVVFGRIAEIVDRGSTSCFASGSFYLLLLWLLGCPCIYSCFYRSKMRGQFNLAESPCPDCCVHCFCEYCALCQEYRELNTRGFNMSKGGACPGLVGLDIMWFCCRLACKHGQTSQQAEQQLPPNVPVGMTR